MWDGFAPVDISYSPPVYEGAAALITVHNAGPGAVIAEIWDNPPQPGLTASSHRAIQLRAGDTRTVSAGMIVVKFVKDSNQARPHAAVGWRVMGIARWTP
jgi:hypothetical protein